jgi:hypothetical protein
LPALRRALTLRTLFCAALSTLLACDAIVGLGKFKVDHGEPDAETEPEDRDGEGPVDGEPEDGSTGEEDAELADAQTQSQPMDAGAGPVDDAASDSGQTMSGDSGTAPCDGLVCDGVCVPADSAAHCGRCDHDCTSLPNVTGATCSAGRCVFSASDCASGYAHCSSEPDDGCEVDITQPAHCGSCGTACGASQPLCVGGAGGSSSCASGCSASAPTLCGQTCVNTATSAAHCNGCNMPCPAVTGGQAVCQNSQCGFTCNADRHRCGNTCAPNDSISQCGSGCVACPQPTGGTAACVSGSCSLSCGSGYVKSGNDCLSQYLYVSTTGNDANSGTSLVSPLRSFGRAMAIAVAGQTVRFASGTYGSATGDTFSQQVPNGVNLERNGAAGTVTFQSNGSGSFVLAGSSNISNINVDNFAVPMGITTGTQTLNEVNFNNVKGAIIISGGARVTINGGGLSGAPTAATEFMLIQDSATLNWSSGVVISQFADCSVTTSGLRALGSSRVTITGFNLSGRWNSSSQTAPLYLDTDGAIDISNGSFDNQCEASAVSLVVGASSRATLNLFNCSFGGMIGLSPVASVKIRQCSFRASAGINLLGNPQPVLDLGRSGDLGGNSFASTTQSAIGCFNCNNTTIDAAGNTWVANQQGADASGRYPSGATSATLSLTITSGRNFALIGTNNLVRF